MTSEPNAAGPAGYPLDIAADALRLVARGLLGAYTTFGTWMLETERLAGGGRPQAAVANTR